jgi:hypothetical protein
MWFCKVIESCKVFDESSSLKNQVVLAHKRKHNIYMSFIYERMQTWRKQKP